MTVFSYRASDGAGNLVKGSMEASDRPALVAMLRNKGYYPIEIDEGRAGASGALSALRPGKGGRGRGLLDFTRELSAMLQAGVPMDRAVSMLAGLEKSEKMKAVLKEVLKGIKSGRSLADSLARHPDVFSGVYVATVMAGEAGGSLDEALERLAGYLEGMEALRDEIASALIYPAILTVVGGAAVGVMLFFVVPRFAVLFEGSGAAMPLVTRALLFASRAIGKWWPVMALFSAAAAAALFLALRGERARAAVDGLVLKSPVAGPVAIKAAVSRYARTLGTLLKGGIPILESLAISVKTLGNRRFMNDLAPVAEGVRRGRTLASCLGEIRGFPPMAVYLISVGEETGRLDETLIRLAGKYERDVSVSVKRLMSVLEPAIILVMALVVGFIVISLILAIFSLNDMPI